jgi:LPXTG-motif cell wall-anchored protein
VGVSVPHTWAAAGTFTVSVTATDKDGGTSAAVTAPVTVAPALAAAAGGPYAIDEGDALVLDGSAANAGASATYAWDVDDDGQFDDATGATPVVGAATLEALGLGDGPATVTVTLRVTDGSQVSTDGATLDVANVAPTAQVVDVPADVVAGTPATVGLAATDPSTADTAAGFTYAVDWGDGSPVQSVTGGVGVSVPHTWAAAGTFTVSVTATDKDGGTSAPATATVTVAPRVVADAGGPYSVDEGADLALDGGAANAGPGATYAWDVDDDGQFDDASGATALVAAATLQALGLGDGPASVTVTLRVTDGSQVSTDGATLDVANVAPTASVDDVPATVVAGIAATVVVGATDPSAADTAAGFTYAVDWGDGSAVETVTADASEPVAHTWTAPGTVTLSVTATDKDGGTSAPATATVTVVPEVVADAGGPYSIDEGDDLVLDGSGTQAGPTATYEWDLDDDGQFDDASGAAVTLGPDDLAPLGLADGPADALPIRLRVTEGSQVSTDETTFEIANVAPVATVDLPSRVVAGTPATVKVGAEDPSPTDAAAQFVYRIDWENDGVVDDEVSGPADPPVTHTYATSGDVGLSVVAVDKDGAASDPTVVTVTVAAAPDDTDDGDGSGGGANGGGDLPRTGASTEALAATAGGLVLAGLLVLVAARVRRRS